VHSRFAWKTLKEVYQISDQWSVASERLVMLRFWHRRSDSPVGT